jgi:hypothetical protein
MDITYSTDYGILVVEPSGALGEKDFKSLASEIDSVAESDRKLSGVLVRTKDFPGYEKPGDVIAHGEFIQEQQKKVGKVALCTDSTVGGLLQMFGQLFTDAEVKKFSYDEKDEAEKWLLS